MIQILKDVFGAYVVAWANDDKLIHTRQFHCRAAAQDFARQLQCRRGMDRLFDEYDRKRLAAPEEEELH